MLTIYIANKCPNLVDTATAQKWVDAWQRGVANDIAAKWNKGSILHYIGDSADTGTDDDGLINIVERSSSPGTLGTHWWEKRPLGEIAVLDCQDDKVEPSSCGFHEVGEMTVDAPGNLCFQVGDEIWAAEIHDRVEASDPTYQIDGVTLENFSLPAAFEPGADGPYDFRGKLTTNTLTDAGYQLIIKLGTAQWEQQTSVLARRSKWVAKGTSRRSARMLRAGADPKTLLVRLR
jgi:hypothetical protein